MKIVALVGQSGTGKSYKALHLAHEKDIEYIIDDGLLIKGNRILAGKSAKRQDTIIGAVKTALFQEEEHRQQVKSAIQKEKPDKILVIGTSERMADKIAQILEIGTVDEYIRIEDISTEEEIKTARKQREELGKHVIPVPTFELKKQFSGYFLDPLKIFRRRKGDRAQIKEEKSVVRPTYSYRGKYIISDRVIKDLVEYVSMKISGVHRVLRVDVRNYPNGIVIWVDISVKYGSVLRELAKEIQKKVNLEVDHMTSLHILAINVTIKEIVVSKIFTNDEQV